MDHAQRFRTSRILKYALLAFAALLFVAAGVIAYFAATFDAKTYAPHLVDIVREKTGRTLTISGDIKLTAWPDLAIETGPLSISERDGTTVFATVASLRLRVKLEPLLSREVIVEGIDFTGAHVSIVRDAEGRLNIDDLLGREGPPAPFDIGRMGITGSALTYRDLGTGDRYEVTNVSVTTGRLTKNVPTNVAFALDLSKADAMWRARIAVKSGLVLDPDQAKTTLDRIVVTGTGDFGQERAEFNVTSAAATIEPLNIAMETVEGVLKASGAAGTTRIKLNAPRLTREAEIYRAAAVAFDLELERGATVVRAAVVGALDGNLATKRVALNELKANVAAEGPRLSRKKVTATASGSAAIDFVKAGVSLKLAGETSGSRLTAEIHAAGFAAPVYTFKVSADKIDLDRYTSGAPASRAQGDKAEDLLQPFADLPASGTLRVGTLKAGEVTANNVTLVLK